MIQITTQRLLVMLVVMLQISAAAPLVFTFGYLRMGSPDVDSGNLLAGYLATIQYANTHNIVPGAQFKLNVTTIPCANNSECSSLSPANRQLMNNFIAAMPGYSAIMKPNYLIANTIVDEATRLGGIPVIDADDIRMASFQNGSDHVINFNANWQRQIDHLFTYMFQTSRCVYSGIVHGSNNMAEYPPHIASVRALFGAAGYAPPPNISSLVATDAAFVDFFMGDSRRRCFIVMGSYRLLRDTMKRLKKFNFNFNSADFYAVSTAAGDDWVINGSSAMYANTHLVLWNPLFDSPTLNQAYQEWLPNVADYSNLFATGLETPPTAVVQPFALQAHMTMMFFFETIRDAIGREASPNTTGPLPLAWSKLVDSCYEGARTVEGYVFNILTRVCPRLPLTQICYCNTLSQTSYMYAINTTTGMLYPVFDDQAKGQRDIASIEIINTCGYQASSWSYPITGLALYPTDLLEISNLRSDDVQLQEAYEILQATYGTMTYETNYAPTAPTRALRYAAYDVPSTMPIQDALDIYLSTLQPFVVYGSMVGKIVETYGVLTLATSLIDIEFEDPVLVPHDHWHWDLISVQPVVADYIHALAGYYASNTASYTSLHAIACTERGAELVSMSFATWGFDVPVGTITVSDDPLVWSSLLTKWLSAGSNSYVVAVTAQSNHSDITTVAAGVLASVGKGTLAVACGMSFIHAAQLATTVGGSTDLIFGAFRSAWWTPDALVGVPAPLLQYVSNPRYQIAMLGLGVAQQLYSKVYYDYTTTAAEILFRTSVISALGTALGPFSNNTCSDEIIAANLHDRNCQCTKGIRTIFVHSMRDYKAGTDSIRTGGYTYTMSTCGVSYSPYVPPVVANSNALSKGAVAGIAVGATMGLLLLILAFVINSVFFGRNNRAAPKDASKPFAIVFTDIQSSTSLWARAPAAMSEAVDQHHELMRKALRKNGGYEVKTVGDSFMVAFKDATNATKFALDAQVMLHAADWHSELDAIYIELIAEAEIEAAETANGGDDVGSQSDVQINYGIGGSHFMVLQGTDGQDRSFNNNSEVVAFHATGKLPRRSAAQSGFAVSTDDSSQKAQGERPIAVTAAARPSSPNHSTAQSIHAMAEESNSTVSATYKSGPTGPWHGIRVRIGVHYGMGDVRKDPVSLGYDYYGTVVNTAARVEGVGHGGQTLLTDSVFEQLPPGFSEKTKTIIVSLGPQPLRGLDAPIHLYQAVPIKLQARRFPALRLHVEKDTEESSMNETATTATGTTTMTETPEGLAGRLCASKQFTGVAPEEIMDRYNYFLATFGPTKDKYQATVITKLAESWGFEKAAKSVNNGAQGRTRLLVSLLAKVTKAFHISQKTQRRRRTNVSYSRNVESVAGKSQHRTEFGSISDTNSKYAIQGFR